MSTSHLVTNWPRKLQETTVHRTHFKHFNMASPLMFDNFEFHSFRNQKHQQKCVPLHSFKPILEMIPNHGCHPNHEATSMPSLRTSNSGSNSWAWAGLCDISQQKRLPSSCACGAVGGSVHSWHLPLCHRGFQPEHHMDSFFIKYLKHDCFMKQSWEGSPVGIFDIRIGDRASVFHQYQ